MGSLLAGLVCAAIGIITVYWVELSNIRRRAPKLPAGHHYGIDPISVFKLGRREAIVAGTALFLAAFVLSR